MKPDTAMMPYQNTPIIDETAAVPLGTPQPPTTMTRGRRSSKRILAIVAGMLMMLMVVAGGGAVVRRFEITDGDRTTTTAAEGLVVATVGDGPCVPATGNFQGLSTTTTWGKYDPFQTCYKYGSYEKYCWTNAYATNMVINTFLQCIPNGGDWYGIDAKLPLSFCPTPCQDQHQDPHANNRSI